LRFAVCCLHGLTHVHAHTRVYTARLFTHVYGYTRSHRLLRCGYRSRLRFPVTVGSYAFTFTFTLRLFVTVLHVGSFTRGYGCVHGWVAVTVRLRLLRLRLPRLHARSAHRLVHVYTRGSFVWVYTFTRTFAVGLPFAVTFTFVGYYVAVWVGLRFVPRSLRFTVTGSRSAFAVTAFTFTVATFTFRLRLPFCRLRLRFGLRFLHSWFPVCRSGLRLRLVTVAVWFTVAGLHTWVTHYTVGWLVVHTHVTLHGYGYVYGSHAVYVLVTVTAFTRLFTLRSGLRLRLLVAFHTARLRLLRLLVAFTVAVAVTRLPHGYDFTHVHCGYHVYVYGYVLCCARTTRLPRTPTAFTHTPFTVYVRVLVAVWLGSTFCGYARLPRLYGLRFVYGCGWFGLHGCGSRVCGYGYGWLHFTVYVTFGLRLRCSRWFYGLPAVYAVVYVHVLRLPFWLFLLHAFYVTLRLVYGCYLYTFTHVHTHTHFGWLRLGSRLPVHGLVTARLLGYAHGWVTVTAVPGYTTVYAVAAFGFTVALHVYVTVAVVTTFYGYARFTVGLFGYVWLLRLVRLIYRLPVTVPTLVIPVGYVVLDTLHVLRFLWFTHGYHFSAVGLVLQFTLPTHCTFTVLGYHAVTHARWFTAHLRLRFARLPRFTVPGCLRSRGLPFAVHAVTRTVWLFPLPLPLHTLHHGWVTFGSGYHTGYGWVTGYTVALLRFVAYTRVYTFSSAVYTTVLRFCVHVLSRILRFTCRLVYVTVVYVALRLFFTVVTTRTCSLPVTHRLLLRLRLVTFGSFGCCYVYLLPVVTRLRCLHRLRCRLFGCPVWLLHFTVYGWLRSGLHVYVLRLRLLRLRSRFTVTHLFLHVYVFGSGLLVYARLRLGSVARFVTFGYTFTFGYGWLYVTFAFGWLRLFGCYVWFTVTVVWLLHVCHTRFYGYVPTRFGYHHTYTFTHVVAAHVAGLHRLDCIWFTRCPVYGCGSHTHVGYILRLRGYVYVYRTHVYTFGYTTRLRFTLFVGYVGYCHTVVVTFTHGCRWFVLGSPATFGCYVWVTRLRLRFTFTFGYVPFHIWLHTVTHARLGWLHSTRLVTHHTRLVGSVTFARWVCWLVHAFAVGYRLRTHGYVAAVTFTRLRLRLVTFAVTFHTHSCGYTHTHVGLYAHHTLHVAVTFVCTLRLRFPFPFAVTFRLVTFAFVPVYIVHTFVTVAFWLVAFTLGLRSRLRLRCWFTFTLRSTFGYTLLPFGYGLVVTFVARLLRLHAFPYRVCSRLRLLDSRSVTFTLVILRLDTLPFTFITFPFYVGWLRSRCYVAYTRLRLPVLVVGLVDLHRFTARLRLPVWILRFTLRTFTFTFTRLRLRYGSVRSFTFGWLVDLHTVTTVYVTVGWLPRLRLFGYVVTVVRYGCYTRLRLGWLVTLVYGYVHGLHGFVWLVATLTLYAHHAYVTLRFHVRCVVVAFAVRFVYVCWLHVTFVWFGLRLPFYIWITRFLHTHVYAAVRTFTFTRLPVTRYTARFTFTLRFCLRLRTHVTVWLNSRWLHVYVYGLVTFVTRYTTRTFTTHTHSCGYVTTCVGYVHTFAFTHTHTRLRTRFYVWITHTFTHTRTVTHGYSLRLVGFPFYVLVYRLIAVTHVWFGYGCLPFAV